MPITRPDSNRILVSLACACLWMGAAWGKPARAQSFPGVPNIPAAPPIPDPVSGGLGGAGANPLGSGMSGFGAPGGSSFPSAGAGASPFSAPSPFGSPYGSSAIPGSTLPSNVPAPTAAAGAAGGGSPSIWSFMGISKSNCDALKLHCKEFKAKLCQSPAGALVSNGLRPVSLLTGGLFGPCCPASPELAQAAANDLGGVGPGATAAEIAKNEAQAKARVAAIEYLSTVDCRYWPDAKAEILKALRSDPNECVRFAAAKALARGCCCTEETVKALKAVVDGKEDDGHPKELSPRVIQTSKIALARCETRLANDPMPSERRRPTPADRREEPPPAPPEAPAPLPTRAPASAMMMNPNPPTVFRRTASIPPPAPRDRGIVTARYEPPPLPKYDARPARTAPTAPIPTPTSSRSAKRPSRGLFDIVADSVRSRR